MGQPPEPKGLLVCTTGNRHRHGSIQIKAFREARVSLPASPPPPSDFAFVDLSSTSDACVGEEGAVASLRQAREFSTSEGAARSNVAITLLARAVRLEAKRWARFL
jgi:hypothetical protein